MSNHVQQTDEVSTAAPQGQEMVHRLPASSVRSNQHAGVVHLPQGPLIPNPLSSQSRRHGYPIAQRPPLQHPIPQIYVSARSRLMHGHSSQRSAYTAALQADTHSAQDQAHPVYHVHNYYQLRIHTLSHSQTPYPPAIRAQTENSFYVPSQTANSQTSPLSGVFQSNIQHSGAFQDNVSAPPVASLQLRDQSHAYSSQLPSLLLNSSSNIRNSPRPSDFPGSVSASKARDDQPDSKDLPSKSASDSIRRYRTTRTDLL